jgi:hypothetical protein
VHFRKHGAGFGLGFLVKVGNSTKLLPERIGMNLALFFAIFSVAN